MHSDVRLVPVSKSDEARIAALSLAPDQLDLVASNAESLAEARKDKNARPRAILADGNLVGFLMYDAISEPGEAQIYRFMIDRHYQGQGFGMAALRKVIDEIAALASVQHIAICYEPENEGARRLYAKAGFIEQGLDEDGEMIAHLELSR